MRGATVRTKLDRIQPRVQRSDKDYIIDERDAVYKQEMKEDREGRNNNDCLTPSPDKVKAIKECSPPESKEAILRNTGQGRLLLVDYMLVKQEKRNKWSMPCKPEFYTVDKINGSRITARWATEERTICRDIFKLVNTVINSTDDRGITKAGESNTTADPDLKKFTSLTTYVEKPSIPAMGEENKRKEQSEEQNQEQTETGSDQIQSSERQTETDPESCRPQRTRRRPSYLKDYVLT